MLESTTVSHHSLATWRVVSSGPGSGATQMALDEAVWQTVAERHSSPTLRLYAWDPPCLSLGRHQSVREVDRPALHQAGYDLVRRPTGGQAILHVDELTYSVVVPLSDPRVRGGVLASCERLSAGLLEGLRILGVQEPTAQKRIHSRAAPAGACFDAPGEFEVVVAGRKLIGSAQMRGRGVLLQHGTLPLHGDIARICGVLAVPPEARHLRSRAATLEEALGHEIPWHTAASALAEGLARALDLRLEHAGLTPEERTLASRLSQDKYASDAWTAAT